MLKLYNTLSRKKEVFKPLSGKRVGLYACGPTVYWFAHIGNLRTYIFEDILKRVLEYNHYQVKHVMNITDVGHLTSDADTGEDKIEKGARREGKTAWEIAEFYADAFKKDLKKLNIKPPTLWTKATDYIKEQIDLIKTLESKGFAYQIADGIYFDTLKLKDYGKLTGAKKRQGNPEPHRRIEMAPDKKNPTDFALWKLTPPGVKRQMEWDSPWGKGFPGWHTECVAMSEKNLGVPFDIHCGGIDHIPIHHTNELAQSEAAFDKDLARFWLHGEFLRLKAGRMGKSEGNIILVKDIVERGFDPLAYRYLCLTSRYRSKLNFSWSALKGAQNSLDNLRQKVIKINSRVKNKTVKNNSLSNYREEFLNFINDDLNAPRALVLLWSVVKNKKMAAKDKKKLLSDFDKVLGLDLVKIKKEKIPAELLGLAEQRQKYREQGLWQKSDEIREEIKKLGYLIEDTKEGPEIKKV
ncbi:MAG: cysteine--tRNA ligase [bacterium]